MIYKTKRFSFWGFGKENPISFEEVYKRFGLDKLLEITNNPKIKKLKEELDKDKTIYDFPRIDLALSAPEEASGKMKDKNKVVVLGTLYDGPDIGFSLSGALLYDPKLDQILLGFGYGAPNFTSPSAFKKELLKRYSNIIKDLDKVLTSKEKSGILGKLNEYQKLVVFEINKRL